jgi:mono/diheme cytochrome c family protein
MRLGGWTRKALWGAGLGLVLSLASFAARPALAADPTDEAADPVKRGAYLFIAGNCKDCHTNKEGGAPLAGGLPLATDFGTFYTPNISPDKEFGIGNWTDADFINAFRNGISPTGSYYYPSFPFTSFTNMTDEDIKAIRAYLMTQKPQKIPNKKHDLTFPFSIRPGLALWRALFFTPGPYLYDRAMDEVWNRGAYLVNGIAHCGECHTARNALGALDKRDLLGGGKVGKSKPPNITSDPEHGIGKWTLKDITGFLVDGVTPSGDVVSTEMKEVVNETSKLTPEDRMAIAIYLKSVPPVIKH